MHEESFEKVGNRKADLYSFNIQWSNRQILPTPTLEISEVQYQKMFFIYTPSAHLHMQLFIVEDSKMEFSYMNMLWGCNFAWFPDRVLMIASKYMLGTQYKRMRAKLNHSRFLTSSKNIGFAVKYFRVGCTHANMKIQGTGLCLAQYTCPDCGYSEQIDSSG